MLVIIFSHFTHKVNKRNTYFGICHLLFGLCEEPAEEPHIGLCEKPPEEPYVVFQPPFLPALPVAKLVLVVCNL